jgi:hypothetical protein
MSSILTNSLLSPFVICLLLVGLVKVAFGEGVSDKEYLVQLFKPGEPGYRPKKFFLKKKSLNGNHTNTFSMWVDSVNCKEKSCEIVGVQLSWDSFGRYKSFKLKDGATLTKLDHKDFIKEDYQRLQAILSDRTSALAEVDRESLMNKTLYKKAHSSIDGMTGATSLFLRNDVIAGAAYTCFHLWDLANSRVPPFIRRVTMNESDPTILKSYLKSKESYQNLLALNALKQRKIMSDDIPPLIDEMISRKNHDVIPPLIEYLMAVLVDKSQLKERLLEIFSGAFDRQRVAMLGWLLEKPSLMDEKFLLGLCRHFSKLESYREVQLLLSLCQKNQVHEELMVPHVFKLLSHDKFFVQRRAYHFLKEQQMNSSEETILKSFAQKYESRL